MMKFNYEITTLSSLIISPRSDRAFYRELDDSVKEYCCKNTDDKFKIIYPFYRYGEYESYSPAEAEYYIPGSSIKGAFINSDGRGRKLNSKQNIMVEDIKISPDMIVLRNLCKFQYINDSNIGACLGTFFENVGVEMVREHVALIGELYSDSVDTVKCLLENANRITKRKIKQMSEYLERLKETEPEIAQDIHIILNNLKPLQNQNDIFLLGGYKGILHSVCLNNIDEINSAVFIDRATKLPHGLVSITLAGKEIDKNEIS